MGATQRDTRLHETGANERTGICGCELVANIHTWSRKKLQELSEKASYMCEDSRNLFFKGQMTNGAQDENEFL